MFRKNESYKQQGLFDCTQQLTKKQNKMLMNSKEHAFFELIFKSIDEEKFRVLYSTQKSRPNVGVNQLVGSLILKHSSNWTYEELFKNLAFNMLTRHAIGINDWAEDAFAEASLFNFQNRLMSHYVETGEDLLEQVFDGLTNQQLEMFGVKTDIQRGDSFLMGSNIIDYTRLNLLLEVLLRLIRKLEESDKEQVGEIIGVYTKQTAGQYIHRLDRSDFPKELAKLGMIYHNFYERFKADYGEQRIFKIFERVFFDHFTIAEDKVELKPTKALHSGILMSPDDEDATYRDKGKVSSKGFVGHISETANPENQLNLITDIAVKPNNVDDGKILEERLPMMVEKTPELNEYHADSLYGNAGVDDFMKEHGVKQIQSTIKGRKPGVKIRMSQEVDGRIMVSCEGGQKVEGIEKENSYRAEFDISICHNCPLRDKCGTRETGMKRGNNPHRVKTFTKETLAAHIRLENIKTIPEQRRTLRANVEASVKECKRGIKNGKLRIRGQQKAKWYLVCTAIAINLIRIHKYLAIKAETFSIFIVIDTVLPDIGSSNRQAIAA